MKHSIYFMFAGLSFLIAKNSFGQKDELTIYKPYFDNQFKSWTQTFKHFSLSSFQKRDSIPFENIEYMDIKELPHFYFIYKPALTFSKDNTQFIDIYSYWLNLEREGKKIVSNGGEVEQAITLCNLKTKKWTRILFCGSTSRIDEVYWVTNTKFILAGTERDEDEDDLFYPKIYIGDTKKKKFLALNTIDSSCVSNEKYYASPKLKKLNIQPVLY
jgi:hypothetical protein